MSVPRAAVVDVDGTLVDSVYQHAICWHRAFAESDLAIPVWRCHRAIGMGGDQLVPELAGERVESDRGDRLRERQNELFAELIDDVRPLPGAAELIEDLSARGHEIVLASSAEEANVERHIDDLGIGEAIAGYTTSADVAASKPDPDLIDAALERTDPALRADAILIGDSVWDVEAAARAGLGCIALLTGGFAASELREAGAAAVFTDPPDLVERLAETPLG